MKMPSRETMEPARTVYSSCKESRENSTSTALAETKAEVIDDAEEGKEAIDRHEIRVITDKNSRGGIIHFETHLYVISRTNSMPSLLYPMYSPGPSRTRPSR